MEDASHRGNGHIVHSVHNGFPSEKLSKSSASSLNSSQPRARVELKKKVTLFSGVTLIVGTMIGSGIFISPGGVMRGAGSVGSALLLWIACGVLSMCSSLCYVELGCLLPKSGGDYYYLLTAFGPLHKFFGPLPAFLFAWASVLILKPVTLSIIMLAFSRYILDPFFLDCEPPRAMLITLTIAGLGTVTFLNCYSTKCGTYTQNLFTLIKMTALATILVGGFYKLATGRTYHLMSGFEGSVTDPAIIALAFYDGLWAYDGWNNLNYCTEELQDPYRNLPRAILIAIPIVTVFYALVNISYLTVLSPSDMIQSTAVAVVWAERVIPVAAFMVPLCVACSTFGAANGSIFGAGRLCFAAAREGHMLSILSFVHAETMTPTPSMIFTGLIAMIMVIPSNIDQLINYFSFTAWMFYGLTFVALIVMRWTKKDAPRPYRVPIAMAFIVTFISAFLVIAPIVQDPQIEFLYALMFIMSGILVYIPFVYCKRTMPGLKNSEWPAVPTAAAELRTNSADMSRTKILLYVIPTDKEPEQCG